jgi:prefoldin subunit 5
MNQRLDQLRAEYNVGRQQLQQLDRKRQQLRDTLLRISGAIQVLEEIERGVEEKERSGVEHSLPSS